MYLILLQLAQTEPEEAVGSGKHQQHIEQVHVPPFVEGRGNHESYADNVRLSVHGVHRLHAEGVGTLGDVGETDAGLRRPRAPFVVVHLVSVQVLSHDGAIGE